MTSLTTNEELHKLHTIIFGFYQSQKENLQAGEIIGVGKLTKKKVSELVYEVLKYLNAYNAMLRDYTGTELFSIEFELKNFIDEQQDLKIIPKSMILIPGEYKDCNILSLTLTRETNLLDVNKAKESIDNLGKLFFEVEEITQHPNLNEDERRKILEKFATRFAYKIQGELIEGKWNKKLVGIKDIQLTEKSNFSPFLIIQGNYIINWNHYNRDISTDLPKESNISKNLDEQEKFEHLKWDIFGPSAFYTIQRTFQLSSNLLKVSNMGSIDEYQESTCRAIVEELQTFLKSNNRMLSIEEINNEIDKELLNIKEIIDVYIDGIRKFCISGTKGNLDTILECLQNNMNNVNTSQLILKLSEILLAIIKNSTFINLNSIKSSEISSCADYFNQIIKYSFDTVKNNFKRYLSYVYLLRINKKFLLDLYSEILKEEKPAKNLGSRYIIKISDYLLNKINEYIINLKKQLEFNTNELETIFKKIIQEFIENNLNEIPIYIEDLLSFAELMIAEETPKVKDYIINLKKVRTEFSFMLSFILRYSSINRFIKELQQVDQLTPQGLTEIFIEFISKRIGALELYWKDYFIEIVKKFVITYQEPFNHAIDEKKRWSAYQLISTFINFLKKELENILTPQKFTNLMDNYIAKIQQPTQQAIMVLLFEQYEYSLSILDEFPNYLKQKILKVLGNLSFKLNPIMAIDYLKKIDISISGLESENNNSNSLNDVNSNYVYDFFEFIDEFELKYFSKLIARPSRVLLKSIDENKFKQPLYYLVEFKFWEKFFKSTISSNWDEIKL